ncbi:HlyD family secretion protein [Frigoriglobus tundricola]|uniref:Membrane fusion component of MSF-type tripartite multidrug efflux system n=1 Tax=Frigoriglobus tundricola TaxID=2774151 RepID=A0A6M5YQI9_9BACT|nr:HlyD family secretion protein [Frigoriglobus tundricola]QJW96289.1 Membrane fusion component of MSF-type tripartite multidrug efflux system [Frigoriglobus tundricola]
MLASDPARPPAEAGGVPGPPAVPQNPGSVVPAGPAPPPDPADRRRSRVRWVSGVSLALLLVIVFGLVPYVRYRQTHSLTDDAFVESHLTHLGAQTPGLITRVLVEERDTVKAGQLLAEIDPEPHRRTAELAASKRAKAESELALERATWERLEQEYPRKVAAAKADLAFAQAGVAQARTELEVVRVDVDKAVREAEAAATSAKASYVKAAEDAERYEKLFKQESVPKVKWEDAVKALATADAEVKTAEAKLDRAQSNRRKVAIAEQAVAVAVAHRDKANEGLRLAELGRLNVEEAALKVKVLEREVDQARRNEAAVRTQLEYCRVVAPFDGTVVKRYRNPGDYAPLGSPILSIYDPDLVYVTAYLEEDRLAGVSPGSPVALKLDAFSDPLPGRVVWVGQATGANFALVPRDISSGEFTKVPQRVPVRILPDRDARWGELRPGLSVSVVFDHGAGDPDWARTQAERMRARGELGVSPLGTADGKGRP